jgi:hypothetical protein
MQWARLFQNQTDPVLPHELVLSQEGQDFFAGAAAGDLSSGIRGWTSDAPAKLPLALSGADPVPAGRKAAPMDLPPQRPGLRADHKLQSFMDGFYYKHDSFG